MTLRPREVRRNDASRRLSIVWDDGAKSSIGYGDLRENCRCSRCRAARQRGVPPPEVRTELTIETIAEFGGDALRFHFSDGHDTGIYPWEYLFELSHAGRDAKEL